MKMIKIQDPIRIVNLKWELASQELKNAPTKKNRAYAVDIANPLHSNSLSFPISSELVLLDSKKSIRTGVKNALVWFHSQSISVELYQSHQAAFLRNKQQHHQGFEDDDYYDDEVDDDDFGFKANGNQLFPEKSTLKRVNLPGNYKLLGLVQRRIQRILDEKFPLPVNSSFKICIVNTVLQDFETEDLSSIYNKLFRKEGKEKIIQIIELSFYDKYPLEQLDNFYDELFGSIGISSEYNIFGMSKPSFYKYYSDIWRLDRNGFKDYNYQCFIDYCEEQQQQQYDYDEEDFKEEWLHELVNQGILMNVEKFYFYFNRKVAAFRETEEKIMISRSRRNSRQRSSGGESAGFAADMKSSIDRVLNTQMRKINLVEREQQKEQTKTQEEKRTKEVKFEEMLVILDFNPEEPSCIIKHDKRYIV